MKCAKVRSHLNEYLENELSAGQMDEISRHLLACSSCQKELDGLKATIALLGEFGPMEPPLGLNLAIKERLHHHGLGKSPWSRLLSRRVVNRVAAIAAVFLLVFIVSTQAPWLHGDSQPPAFYPQPTSLTRPLNYDYLDPDIPVRIVDGEQPVPYGNGYLNSHIDVVE